MVCGPATSPTGSTTGSRGSFATSALTATTGFATPQPIWASALLRPGWSAQKFEWRRTSGAVNAGNAAGTSAAVPATYAAAGPVPVIASV